MLATETEYKNKFRSILPECSNRDMWVNETYLEFLRWSDLQVEDKPCSPLQESLLMTFLTRVAGIQSEKLSKSNNFGHYKEAYGYDPEYCWTIDFQNRDGGLPESPNPYPATG